jgi:hypothetical protein
LACQGRGHRDGFQGARQDEQYLLSKRFIVT